MGNEFFFLIKHGLTKSHKGLIFICENAVIILLNKLRISELQCCKRFIVRNQSDNKYTWYAVLNHSSSVDEGSLF